MRAILLTHLGKPFELKEIEKPKIQPGEALIRLNAAALNHRDLWIKMGKYPKINLPCILGSDGAGTVEAVGEGTDSNLRGKEVMINPGLHWGKNPHFPSKDFQILGMPRNGTFADYICIPANHIFPKPAHLSFVEAAALSLTGVTAYRALFTRAKLRQGEKVFIPGIGGGAALQALQFAVAKGSEVYVSSSSDDKIKRAMDMGAKGGINYKDGNWANILKETHGMFDLIVDSVGGDSFSQFIDLTAPGGRIVVFGGTAGTINSVVPGRIFYKQMDILGTTMGSQEDFTEMLQMVSDHKIRPIIDEIRPLEDITKAFDKMERGKQFGKIVIDIKS